VTATCRSCGADIVWAETVPAGRKVPLDAATVDPTARGALILVGNRYAYGHADLADRIAQRQAVSVARAEDVIRSRYDAHLSHFATCPTADRHRKDR
jgi:hypothetical protein